MRRVTRIVSAVLLVGALLTAAACGADLPQAGFEGSSGSRDWEAGFGVWDGSETQVLDVAGERSLELDFRAAIKEGTVTFVMTDESGESIWELTATEDIADSVELPLPGDGDYKITAYGTRATGDFRFSW